MEKITEEDLAKLEHLPQAIYDSNEPKALKILRLWIVLRLYGASPIGEKSSEYLIKLMGREVFSGMILINAVNQPPLNTEHLLSMLLQ